MTATTSPTLLRSVLLGVLLAAITVACAGPGGDAPEAVLPPAPDELPRAIRRDVPLTNSIRRAHAAGTRGLDGRPGPNYWQLETDFTIRASLDPAAHTITGSESIVVRNTSPDELRSIALRLDHNIFRPRVPRGSSVPAETTEGMVVTRIAVDGVEVDLEAGGRRGDDDEEPRASARGLDQTLATLSLAEPVPAGGRATIEIDWTTVLPGGPRGRGHRMTMRWDEKLFQPTQWFPRLAKYDDLRGWDRSVYLGPAEFYNNYGRFDVRIDVPAGWLVSATGVLQNPEEVLTPTARERLARVLDSNDEITIVGEDEVGPGAATAGGDRLTWHYVAERVNDFAWATAENYVWKATRATIPGRGPIPIHMLHLPERAGRYEEAGEITRHALEFYSDLWTPYEYPQITLQDGPSAGMEYPMVLNSNQGAADHEAAHQWWPMMVGTNETWYGWMDEGLNSYMNILSGAHRRGVAPSLDGRGQAYGRTSGTESEPTMMWAANYGGSMYGFQTYVKTTMMLSMLGGIVGDDEVQRAIKAYTRTWTFKHPCPWDFVFHVSDTLAENHDGDLGWFWYYWLFTTESVEGSIDMAAATETGAVVRVRQSGEMPAPVVLRVEFADGDEPVTPGASMPNVEMLQDGAALVTWPVDVWFDGRRTFDAVLDFGPRRITRVQLDPGGRFPDANPDDNVWERAD